MSVKFVEYLTVSVYHPVTARQACQCRTVRDTKQNQTLFYKTILNSDKIPVA